MPGVKGETFKLRAEAAWHEASASGSDTLLPEADSVAAENHIAPPPG